MRRRVTIQSRDVTRNDYGQQAETYTDVGDAGADVRAVSLSEVTSLNREISISVLQFDFYPSERTRGLTTNNRLVFNGRNFDVLSIDNVRLATTNIRVIAEERT